MANLYIYLILNNDGSIEVFHDTELTLEWMDAECDINLDHSFIISFTENNVMRIISFNKFICIRNLFTLSLN